ncbi:MAG: hypothetical protein MZU95_00015 [Desulfomicrobium escambiense]|nr:hypothetical protein [Desulfomicrobium escambiense]
MIGDKDGAYAVILRVQRLPQPGLRDRVLSWARQRSCSSPRTATNRSSPRETRCRSAPSCGSTTATRHPTTRASTWRRSGTGAEGPWPSNDTIEADLVSGIPDSGIGHAIGYAIGKGIPYMRPYVKYTPTWPRELHAPEPGSAGTWWPR